jgi:hypothetical protein
LPSTLPALRCVACMVGDPILPLARFLRAQALREAEAAGAPALSVLASTSKARAGPGAAAAPLMKWRLQCLVEALAAPGPDDVGVDRAYPVPARADVVVARKGARRGGMSSRLSLAECARVGSTIVFVNSGAAVEVVRQFLKTAGT